MTTPATAREIAATFMNRCGLWDYMPSEDVTYDLERLTAEIQEALDAAVAQGVAQGYLDGTKAERKMGDLRLDAAVRAEREKHVTVCPCLECVEWRVASRRAPEARSCGAVNRGQMCTEHDWHR